MIYILVAAACFLLWLFPGVRCALTHPFHCIYYGVKDGYNYIRYKQGNLRKTGNLDIFCGYFGNGKTLSLVKQVVCREYKRYDGLTVWCNRRQKFVTQRILILSNVDLCVPYERLTGLVWLFEPKKHLEIKDARRAPRPIYKSAGIGNAALAVWGACIYGPPDVPYMKLMRFRSSLIQGVEIMERATL